jgi:hypothetical protein
LDPEDGERQACAEVDDVPICEPVAFRIPATSTRNILPASGWVRRTVRTLVRLAAEIERSIGGSAARRDTCL